jgi:outer membrane protein
MIKNTINILLFGLISSTVFSQNTLTTQQAVDITLTNNYGIQIAKNNIQIAQNNTDKKANGYLPTVDARGGLNADLGGSTQKFSGGMEVATSNALAWDGNAGVAANYTVYNERREAVLEQLKENLNLTNLQLRQTIENNLIQVYNQYYELARLATNLNVLQQTIETSRQRLERAQIGLDYGQGSGLDVLNAQVDIQRDSVNILNAQQALVNAQRRLNVVMGRTTTETFSVDTTVNYATNLTLVNLQTAALENNVNLLLNRQNLVINEMDLNIIDAEKKPIVTADASYNFNYSNAATGSFIESSNNRGFGLGVGVAWNLYDGGARDIRTQNVQVQLLNQRLQQSQIIQEIERDVINRWGDYQNALFVLDVEKSAVETNRENFERTKEEQKIGQISSIEYRQAQLNLLNAETNLNTAKFAAKVIEMELLQLSGQLLGQ